MSERDSTEGRPSRRYQGHEDIEDFYDADERRRASAEIELGTEWTDPSGNRYELSWVEDTGDLYVMAEPNASVFEGDPIGDPVVAWLPVSEVTVRVLGVVRDRGRLEEILTGWQKAMASPGSVQWLDERLHQGGVVGPEHPGS